PLPRDGAVLLDQAPAHHPALRPGLVRDQRLPEQLRRRRARRGGGPHQPDAARLAAPARVDLRLHDAGEAEALGGGDGLVDGEARLAVGDGDAVAAQEILRLVLVDVHRGRVPLLAWDVGGGNSWTMHPRGLCAGATAGYAVLMGEIRVQV